MKKELKKEGSIGTKLSIILIISILISTVSIGIFNYVSYRNNAIELTGEKALSIATAVSANIDGDKLLEYDKTGVTDEYYDQIKAAMSEVKEQNGCSYVYSMVDAGDNYKLIISGYLKDEDQSEWGFLGYSDPKDIYTEDPAMVLKDGVGRYTQPQDYGPPFGISITGFAPIHNKAGEVVGLVGIDMPMGVQNKKINQLIPIMAVMILITSIILIVIAYSIIRKTISNPLRRIAQESRLLAKGDTEIRLNQNDLDRNDEIGLLSSGFVEIAENMQEQAAMADRIAGGDLSAEVTPRSEKDVLAYSMGSVIETLKKLVSEANRMTQAAIEGNLENRGNTEQFEGGYKEIIEGFNHTMDALINPLKLSANYIERISKGDIPEKITEEARGDFEELKDDINICIDAIKSLITDTVMLSQAAQDGKLSARADASKHGGDFAKIVQGINQTLDAVINPLNITAGYIERIGKGEIPSKITEEYKGDFNQIKESINSCIDGLDGLVEGRDVLSKMALNDYTNTVQGQYSGIYNEIAYSVNKVIESVTSMTDILTRVSEGELEMLEMLEKTGKRSENDKLIPMEIQLIQNIKSLIGETVILSQAAVEGRLDIRGNVDKFKGEYRTVIQGINETLNAIIAPIEEASDVLEEMSRGNLQVRMEGDYQGDHAVIKNALNSTLDSILSYVSEISGVLTEISEGNLDVAITADYKGDFVEIKDSLNHIIVNLSQVLGDIGNAADQVASGSRQVSDGSQTLSQGSTEQASSIQELTASITEIASQTKQNAINANQANELAMEAKKSAEQGNGQMQEMLSSMDGINEASANIFKIIKVIDGIAFQTNILALNAAVEAARAGQHGKGFAVVAEEVRNLAARSAEAAKETTDLIEGSIHKVQGGTTLAKETAEYLDEIVGGVEKAANLVGKIAEASNEQATGIAQVNKGIEQVSLVVQNNSATAEQSAAASEELSSQAELLKEMVMKFKLSGKNIAGNEAKLLGGSMQTKVSRAQEPQILLGDDEYDKY